MSIASEISRLQTAKADLKTAIEAKGVTVPGSTKLDGYADLVDSISGGGDDDNWYGVCTYNQQPLSHWFVKKTSEKWEMPNPFSTSINQGEGLYFLYKGEKYYASSIRNGVNAILSKNGIPLNLGMSTLGIARIVKQNGNYYVYFEIE